MIEQATLNPGVLDDVPDEALAYSIRSAVGMSEAKVMFVPIPVLNFQDAVELKAEMNRRANLIGAELTRQAAEALN
mgnify:FL=1